jgi:hypothetical protein
MKPVIVITHERSGTHLLINLINYDKNGEFFTIGFIPKDTIPYNVDNYKHQTYKDITINSYRENIVCKSHHQVNFMLPYIDFLFSKFKVIYLKRDVKDVLVSYYKFIPYPEDLKTFPEFKDWIFMKPDDIGRKFLLPYSPDPHVIIEPENYIDRWKIHVNGWMKYKDNLLVLNYEDILNDYKNQKLIIEDYIGKKISDFIPNVNDKKLPNFNPGKGIIGSHKELMNNELINKINKLIIYQ